MFARPAAPSTRMELGGRDLGPQRTCGDGEVVDIQRYEPAAAKDKPPSMQGNALGLGLRDAGATK